MSLKNPSKNRLIVLKVNYKENKGSNSFLFPLNPSDITITQLSRVTAAFTYGEKIFQNLGRGLKTINIVGHTGYRLDKDIYGLYEQSQNSLDTSSINSGRKIKTLGSTNEMSDGASLFLDLYGLIQLIKGENKFINNNTIISSNYSIENLDKIENVQLIIPDQSIVYNVILQRDEFRRSKDQPHLYKYSLDFIVEDEFSKINSFIDKKEKPFSSVSDRLRILKQTSNAIRNLLPNLKNVVSSTIPGASELFDICKNIYKSVDLAANIANDTVLIINDTINDIRRLEKINNSIKTLTDVVTNTRSLIQLLEAVEDGSAFYETKMYSKRLIAQVNLLKEEFQSEKEELSWNVNLSRLSSLNSPITIASNKATIATFESSLYSFSKTNYVIPIKSIEKIVDNYNKRIKINFKESPEIYDINIVRVFRKEDYLKQNNLVVSFTDEYMILNVEDFSDEKYLVEIEYKYRISERLNKSIYKSVRRVKIKTGDTFENILKKYSPDEYLNINTYSAEVAYLNNIEFPYIVTKADSNYESYLGSYASHLFETNESFLKYISNITVTGVEGGKLPLYSYNNVSNYLFIDDQDLIDNISTAGSKFFIVLFKEVYSDRLYALFGIYSSTVSSTGYLFGADKYVLIGLEKGYRYEVLNNVIWEILSPYNITPNIIESYSNDVDVNYAYNNYNTFFEIYSYIIKKIYSNYIGEFSFSSFIYTEDDIEFLSGNDYNKQFVILTNFIYYLDEKFTIECFKKYKVLMEDQYILLPSISNSFLTFKETINDNDIYKIDLDIDFVSHEIIRPRIDISPTSGEIDFSLVSGIANVKQAIKHRLETPKGGLRIHNDYGLLKLLGRKSTLENTILLKYNIYEQLTSDNRIKSVKDIVVNNKGDSIFINSTVVLINDDELSITQ
jgi:hypothetical protein